MWPYNIILLRLCAIVEKDDRVKFMLSVQDLGHEITGLMGRVLIQTKLENWTITEMFGSGQDRVEYVTQIKHKKQLKLKSS